jgi:methylenetetrahydrofolate dehydrogenase (NADP+) / methenyltetrahydrofolate cyclohydrolase
MDASKTSAEQKVKSFEHLGFETDHIVLPHDDARPTNRASARRRDP